MARSHNVKLQVVHDASHFRVHSVLGNALHLVGSIYNLKHHYLWPLCWIAHYGYTEDGRYARRKPHRSEKYEVFFDGQISEEDIVGRTIAQQVTGSFQVLQDIKSVDNSCAAVWCQQSCWSFHKVIEVIRVQLGHAKSFT